MPQPKWIPICPTQYIYYNVSFSANNFNVVQLDCVICKCEKPSPRWPDWPPPPAAHCRVRREDCTCAVQCAVCCALKELCCAVQSAHCLVCSAGVTIYTFLHLRGMYFAFLQIHFLLPAPSSCAKVKVSWWQGWRLRSTTRTIVRNKCKIIIIVYLLQSRTFNNFSVCKPRLTINNLTIQNSKI